MDLKDIKSKKAKAVVLEFAWGLFTYSEYLSWHVSNTLIHYPSLILAILVVKSYGNSKENKLWVNFFYVLVWSEGSKMATKYKNEGIQGIFPSAFSIPSAQCVK